MSMARGKRPTVSFGLCFWRWSIFFCLFLGKRFPHKGEFKLSANEKLEFSNPKPTLFAAMVPEEGKEFKLHIRIREKDVIHDDTFLDSALGLPWANLDQSYDLKSKVSSLPLSVSFVSVLVSHLFWRFCPFFRTARSPAPSACSLSRGPTGKSGHLGDSYATTPVIV